MTHSVVAILGLASAMALGLSGSAWSYGYDGGIDPLAPPVKVAARTLAPTTLDLAGLGPEAERAPSLLEMIAVGITAGIAVGTEWRQPGEAPSSRKRGGS